MTKKPFSVLFRLYDVKVEDAVSAMFKFYDPFRTSTPKEKKAKKKDDDFGEFNERMEFVCVVKDMAAVEAAVRENPHCHYVLFHGHALPVSVSMPVSVDGRAIASFWQEWVQD